MARYRKIDPRIWNDAKFRAMSDHGQLLFLFVLTHPHMTALGAMRASLDGLAAEKGWTSKAFREAFAEASRKGLLQVDEKACFVAAPKFLKYNPPESPNVVKSWVNSLDLLPECDAKNRLISEVFGHLEGLGEAFRKALPEAFAKAMPNQEQEQEQEQEISSGNGPENETPEEPKEPEDTPQDVLAAWRRIDAVPQPRDLSPGRLKKLRTRLKGVGWPWREALAKLPLPDDGSEKPWQPSIDWLIDNERNARRIAEGEFDFRAGLNRNREPKSGESRAGTPPPSKSAAPLPAVATVGRRTGVPR